MALSAMPSHACSSCGYSSPKWFGRCPTCGGWGSAPAAEDEDRLVVVPLSSVGAEGERRWRTGIGEVDRVLGGGLVAGEVLLLAGEPGIGKSTLVLQLVDALSRSGRRALLVSGEESLSQVSLRARRLGIAPTRVEAACSSSLEGVLAALASERPDVAVIDSVQTLQARDLDNAAGSPVQVRDCAAKLTSYAKQAGTAIVLVGHVTKDGAIAGPKTLEHIVDAVLTLEGERATALRLLRATKNRFGSCEETGVFVMGAKGLEPVADPSAMLLADRRAGVSGSVVFPAVEGTRTLLVEIQALVATSSLAQPRRVAIGIDGHRLSLLIGVLAQHLRLNLQQRDVFVAAAGGLGVREPAADLAVCLALVSAARNVALQPTLVAVGEVGLGGEIRRAPALDRRLAEAGRLRFDAAVVARRAGTPVEGLRILRVGDLQEAVDALDMSRERR